MRKRILANIVNVFLLTALFHSVVLAEENDLLSENAYQEEVNWTQPISVTGITLDETGVSMERGHQQTLKATVEPANATVGDVIWSSSNESVAQVSEGIVTALGEGISWITATTADGAYTESCWILVMDQKEEAARYYGEVTPLAFDATIDYLNEIYLDKYPELGLEPAFGGGQDWKVLQALVDSIIVNCTSDEEKAMAIAGWIQENIEYMGDKEGDAYGHPIDIYYNKHAINSGFAQLMTELLRFAGIPAASCSGYTEDESGFALIPIDTEAWDGNAWTMAYYDDAWHLYDIVFGVLGATDSAWISERYYFSNVDWVCPYYDGRVLNRTLDRYANVYYFDRFLYVNLDTGIPFSSGSGRVANIVGATDGELLIMNIDVETHSGTKDGVHDAFSYCDDLERKWTMIDGECYSNGWIGMYNYHTHVYNKQYRCGANGILEQSVIRKSDENLYYIDNMGNSVLLAGNAQDYALMNGLLAVKIGETLPLHADFSVKEWISSDDTIATVDESGVVHALAPGKVQISWTQDADWGIAQRAIHLVIVPQYYSEMKYVTDIVLSATSISLNIGETAGLTATILPEDAANSDVIWTSSQPGIVSVDENGTVSAISAGEADIIAKATDGSNSKAICTVTVTKPQTDPVPERKDVISVFDDIKSTDWWHDAVQYAYDNNIMSGMGTSFKPTGKLTREQFVQVLYNNSGTPAVDDVTNKFSDVKSGQWYTNAVLWANANKIANGNANGTFGVGKNITREALAQMLYQYASLNNYDLTTTAGTINQFADGAKVSSWASEALDWAVTQGIMSGKGSGSDLSAYRLDPQGTATRAECASMMMKLLQKNE